MFENILYALPEITILIGMSLLLLNAVFVEPNSKLPFKITKTTAMISAFFSILFYNKSFLSPYLISSSYTALSFTLTVFLAYIWLTLSSKSFVLLKEVSQTRFCVLALGILFFLLIFIKSAHFGVLTFGFAGLAVFQFLLFRQSKQSEELYHTGVRYAVVAGFLLCLLLVAIYFLRHDGLFYQNAAEALVTATPFIKMAVIVSIFCVFLFLIGAAPFHFWLADSISPLILPVAAYFSVVPLLAFWSVFFKLNVEFFSLSTDNLKKLYFGFGALSIICGSLGANTSRFLRKIFAFVGLYHTGVVLLLMGILTTEALVGSYIYVELYLILMLGIYVCFYTFKINGNYASTINDLEGMVSMRPYISAAFLLLIISSGALPPFIGFVMQYLALSRVADHVFWVYLILFGALGLIPVYFKTIQSVYMLPRKNSFDRVDTASYVYLLIYSIFLFALMFKPKILLFQTDILFNMG